jgi:hypothetical protein
MSNYKYKIADILLECDFSILQGKMKIMGIYGCDFTSVCIQKEDIPSKFTKTICGFETLSPITTEGNKVICERIHNNAMFDENETPIGIVYDYSLSPEELCFFENFRDHFERSTRSPHLRVWNVISFKNYRKALKEFVKSDEYLKYLGSLKKKRENNEDLKDRHFLYF